jgi:aldehyde dehydrogenase (NAD+)
MEIDEPLGCVAIICGQNEHPLLTFVMHLMAAISRGNTAIIVPSEKRPLPALDLYEIFECSDMPDGVVNILTGNKHHLTKYLAEHQQVHGIWYQKDAVISDEEELFAQQFIKFTCNYNLKKCWFPPANAQLEKSGSTIKRAYLSELAEQSIQVKHIHMPMGVIFAN